MKANVYDMTKDNFNHLSFQTYLQFFLASAFFLEWHPFLVFFEEFSFGRLKIEPGIRETFDLRQQSFNKRMKFILKLNKTSHLIEININFNYNCIKTECIEAIFYYSNTHEADKQLDRLNSNKTSNNMTNYVKRVLVWTTVNNCQ